MTDMKISQTNDELKNLNFANYRVCESGSWVNKDFADFVIYLKKNL